MTQREYRVVTWQQPAEVGGPEWVPVILPRDERLAQAFQMVSPPATLDVAGGMGWEVVQFDRTPRIEDMTLVLTRVRS